MDLLNLLKENYTWFFSGLGVVLLAWIINVFRKSKGNNVIKGHSNGIQAQGNVTINRDGKEN